VTVTLREVTKDNLLEICQLEVSAEQQRFVFSNAVSIAQAYVDREVAWLRAIYVDGALVGFVMLYDDPRARKYFLWRLMIDRRFQRRGYGREALSQVIAHVRQRPGARELLVCVGSGEGGPGPFYEKLGFVYTGAVIEGERVMRKEL
jgi:diamine N-acetyltransferase